MSNFIKWFKDISEKEIGIVGGKGLNLGIMSKIQLPIPPGFVITTYAFKKFLNETEIRSEIFSILKPLKAEDTEKIHEASEKIQDIILDAKMPEDIENEIKNTYDNMNIDIDYIKSINKSTMSMIKAGRDLPFVAVRSSATAEDLPEVSFAGQQATYLNIKGKDNLIKAVQLCWASLYTPRAIYYRIKNKFPHEKVLIAVVIQKMINSTASGVMFSIDPSTNKDEIVIEAGFGLGEAIVGGEISPDNYVINKSNLRIENKKINRQEFMYVRDEQLGRTVKKKLKEDIATKQKLTEKEILKLAELARRIEEHYQKPQDMEFAVEDGKVYIVQSRPITTIKAVERKGIEEEIREEAILNGLGASPGNATGKVKIVYSPQDLTKIEKGDILVAVMTNPDYVPSMEKAAAIVTDEGGTTSHAAIVSRELGIPCIVGTGNATKLLKEEQLITVDGSRGKAYMGITKTEAVAGEEKVTEYYNTRTKIYMNLGEPEKIDAYKNLFFDGIGLMRIEFMVTDKVKKHPLALIKESREDIYIDELIEGISKVASTIKPKPIIVRFSDFKTNEYANLEGGKEFEPHEDNPMIGWRGVSRYISKEYQPAFRLECRAIRKIRNSGLRNVHVMLPFVRNTDEVKMCLDIMKQEGLERNEEFQIYLMAEVPSMAMIPDEFAQLQIDGCSIGSNDLTQLTLGVDRDSGILGRMGYFDERNPAVKQAIKNIIEGFHRHNKTVSLCGQAGSDIEFAKFLVELKIDDISVNPDIVNKIRKMVHEIEAGL